MSSNPHFVDRVLEVSTSTGTGDYTLEGAVSGYQSFSAVGDGSSCYYCATDVDSDGLPSGDWEVGLGTYTASGPTLSRDSVQASSNSGAAVPWGTGTRRVFLVVPATYFASGAFTVSAVGNIDDLDFGGAAVIRMNNSSDATIRGLKAGIDGQKVTLVSIGAGHVKLSHQDTGDGTAANRLINFATSAPTPLAAGSGSAVFVYDASSSRWRLIDHEQGAWITPAFSAGDFTGSGSMTWTVSSGDVVTMTYRLSGRTLTVVFSLDTTTVGGTASFGLLIGNGQWGGFTTVRKCLNMTSFYAGSVDGVGFAYVHDASSDHIELLTLDESNWPLETDGNYQYGQVTFEVA